MGECGQHVYRVSTLIMGRYFVWATKWVVTSRKQRSAGPSVTSIPQQTEGGEWWLSVTSGASWRLWEPPGTLGCHAGPPQRKCSKRWGRKRAWVTHEWPVAAGARGELLELWGREGSGAQVPGRTTEWTAEDEEKVEEWRPFESD